MAGKAQGSEPTFAPAFAPRSVGRSSARILLIASGPAAFMICWVMTARSSGVTSTVIFMVQRPNKGASTKYNVNVIPPDVCAQPNLTACRARLSSNSRRVIPSWQVTFGVVMEDYGLWRMSGRSFASAEARRPFFAEGGDALLRFRQLIEQLDGLHPQGADAADRSRNRH